jgi:hypothetical protein
VWLGTCLIGKEFGKIEVVFDWTIDFTLKHVEHGAPVFGVAEKTNDAPHNLIRGYGSPDEAEDVSDVHNGMIFADGKAASSFVPKL